MYDAAFEPPPLDPASPEGTPPAALWPSPEGTLNPTLGRLRELCGLGRTFGQGWGAWLSDDQQRRFLDFHAQDGAVALGHNAPAVRLAVEQALRDGRPALVQPYRAACAEELADELARHSCMQRCLLTASGAEAVAAALTLARRRTRRPLIVMARGVARGVARGGAGEPNPDEAGEVLGTGVGGGPPAGGLARVPFGDAAGLAACLQRESGRVAALWLAPIDIAGGVVVPPPGYLRAARALCDAHQALLILDESELGLGRTGRLLAAEHEAVQPDILLLGRGLGGGLFRLGALLCRGAVWDEDCALGPGFTGAGNDLSCRVALAVLRELGAGGLCHAAESQGRYLQRQLAALRLRHPTVITAVRGRGLVQAVALQPGAAEPGFFLSHLGGLGLLSHLAAATAAERCAVLFLPTLGGASILRLTPPLSVTREEVDLAIQALDEVCGLLAAGDSAALARALGATHPRHLQAAARRQPRLQLPLPAPAPPPPRPTYAFIFVCAEGRAVLQSDPGLAALDEDELRALTGFAAALPAGVVLRPKTVRSAAGAEADGFILALPMPPEPLPRAGSAPGLADIQRAVDLAARLGAQVVGLGGAGPAGWHSGLSRTGDGPLITSGSTLSALMAVRAIESLRGASWRGARVAVLGAASAVGALCARLFAQKRPERILLCDSPDDELQPLHALAAELTALGAAVSVMSSPRELAEYPTILAAGSAPPPMLDKAPLSPGTLICDLARPFAAPSHVRSRGDLTVIEGGLVALPDRSLRLGAGNLYGLPAGVQQADFAQTLLLAFAKADADDNADDDLIAAAEPTLAAGERLTALAGAHGFGLAAPLRDGRPYCRSSRAARARCKKM